MDKNTEQETAQTAKSIDEQIRDALREAQNAFTSQKTTQENAGTSPRNEPQQTTNPDAEPAWFKKYREEQARLYQQLRNDNEAMKAAKQHEEQKAVVAATAQRLGIPNYLLPHLKVDAEGDVEQQLTQLKQEMVNHKLLPLDDQRNHNATRTLIENDAEEWAKGIEH